MPLEIATHFERLSSTSWWLSRRNAFTILVVSVVLISLSALAVSSIVGVVCLVGGVPVSILGWYLVRAGYWRSGDGYRLAVSFEGSKFPQEVIESTTSLLVSASKRGVTKKLVILRLVPREYVNNESLAQEFLKKYGFIGVVRIGVSRNGENSTNDSIVFDYINAAPEGVNAALLQSALRPLALIASGLARPVHDTQWSEFRSASLYEVILFITATLAVNREDFVDAGNLLWELDLSLSPRFKNSVAPRYAVRNMLIHCLLVPIRRPASDWIAHRETMEETCKEVLPKLVLMVDQFDDPLLSIARALFLFGDRDRALELCKRAESVSKDESFKYLGILGQGAIYLLTGRSKQAVECYRKYYKSDMINRTNWADLVDFADTCRKMNIAGSVALQAMYRKAMDGVVDGELNSLS